MLEAKLKLAMGGSAAPRERHTVGEVVAGYIAAGASRLSPGTLDFYRRGLSALPEVFRNRAVSEVTPLALESVYGEPLRTARLSDPVWIPQRRANSSVVSVCLATRAVRSTR